MLIEQPLKFLGTIDDSLDMMYTNGAVGIGLIYTYLPLMVVSLFGTKPGQIYLIIGVLIAACFLLLRR